MEAEQQLQDTIGQMVRPGTGILAADESLPTIAKRFSPINVESTAETRRAYRSLLFSTPGLGEFVSAAILFEETLSQADEAGTPLPEMLARQGIVPGVKVDKGKIPLPLSSGDQITQGLDGLGERLRTYKAQGARFAKWRAVYGITERNPTALGMEANAEMLARYAAICQNEGIVPIVEPEVLMDGDHDLARCLGVTEDVLHHVFHALHRYHVRLEYMLLKPSMVLPGKACTTKAGPQTVAEATLKVLLRTVPAAVPSINFLSGGQSPAEATANLNAINLSMPKAPWALSFSYGRALQEPVLLTWAGKQENTDAAQNALHTRAHLNSLARTGQYRADQEAVPA